MAVQQEISADLTHAKIGKEFKVIIDRKEGDILLAVQNLILLKLILKY